MGWARQEYAALAVDYDRRQAITDEYMDRKALPWGTAPGGPVRRRLHPLHLTVDAIRRGGRELAVLAEEAGRAAPAIAPRFKTHITDAPVPGADRVAGTGSFDQIRADLHAVAGRGPTAVVDTYDPGVVEHVHNNDLTTIELLAERACRRSRRSR